MEEDVSKLNKAMVTYLIALEVAFIITLVMWFNPFDLSWSGEVIKILWVFALLIFLFSLQILRTNNVKRNRVIFIIDLINLLGITLFRFLI